MIDQSFFLSDGAQLDSKKIKQVMENWTSLNAHLKELDLAELYACYCFECAQLRRRQFLTRVEQKIRVRATEKVQAFLDKRFQQLTQ